MPFPKWSAEPVFLCRKPLPPDKSEPCNFYPITNTAMVNCLRQLASVAKIANKIFDEIGCECRLLAERTEKLKEKVNSCENVVNKLNARAVKVRIIHVVPDFHKELFKHFLRLIFMISPSSVSQRRSPNPKQNKPAKRLGERTLPFQSPIAAGVGRPYRVTSLCLKQKVWRRGEYISEICLWSRARPEMAKWRRNGLSKLKAKMLASQLPE
ncbi:hypothetical protein NPIL_469761 [Nephila pilipes]|uniref:Uncharacterized protein n=1 Tax=Nephila pilipes TaxID=299642 RepID=A0A8X6NGS4_NEPPI|nr:hypothetical protein NPIL_469761 [Nephila pilipes]